MTAREDGSNEGETGDNPEIVDGAGNEQKEVDLEQPATDDEENTAMEGADTTVTGETDTAHETVDQLSADAGPDEQAEAEEASAGFGEKLGDAGRMLAFKILTGNAAIDKFERWASKAQNDGAGYLHNEFKPLLDEHGYNGDDHFANKGGETVIKKLPPKQILSAFRRYNNQQAEQRRDVRAVNTHNERSGRIRDKFGM